MCQLCADNMQSVRVLLAAKIIGSLPGEDDTGLEAVTATVVSAQAALLAGVNESGAKDIAACAAIRARLVQGVRKTLPTLALEDRLHMALAAGIVKL